MAPVPGRRALRLLRDAFRSRLLLTRLDTCLLQHLVGFLRAGRTQPLSQRRQGGFLLLQQLGHITHPVPLIVLGFVAVLLTVDPSARAPALWAILVASCGGLSLVWWWADLTPTYGVNQLIQITALMVGVVVLAYSNWSLTDRHYQAQTRRLRAVADVARRLGLTTDSGVVAAAVLGGCHDTYPDATWGRVLLFDATSGGLATLPLILGPAGVSPASGPVVVMAAGDGVIGRVYSKGDACMLRTPRDIKQAYASMPGSHVGELENLGGGRRARSVVAA